MKLRNILLIGILTAGSLTSCTKSEKGVFVGHLADSKIGRLLAKDTKPDLTKKSGAELVYFRVFGLNVGKSLKTDKVYERLMGLKDREKIKQEIDFFADYVFGEPRDGWTTRNERFKAYEALKKRWYFEEYQERFWGRPFLNVLDNYRGLPKSH